MQPEKRLKAVHADDDVTSTNEAVVQFDAEGRFKIRWRPTWKRIALAGGTVAGITYGIWDLFRKLLEISQ